MAIKLTPELLAGGPQAGFAEIPELRVPWVAGFREAAGRKIPAVPTRLRLADRLGSARMRWDMGRSSYRVLPGLYAAGSPGQNSAVFVSANYKMSFDALRAALDGMDAWLLVLDTKGINVWCAAGKGSFGTDELVRRIAAVKLGEVVGHKVLVLPQLGAPGVAAPEVARRSGFRVQWGPVRAEDIKPWLANGRQKTDAMRAVRFRLKDRLEVTGVELAHAWPVLLAALVLGGLWGLPADPGWLGRAARMAAFVAGLVPVGTVVFMALLPVLPFKAFALKGALLGALWGLAAVPLLGFGWLSAVAAVLTGMPVAAFLAMNFTGSSTFTCQPGAQAEVEKGFWPMVVSLAAGLVLGTAARIIGG
jgi:acetyl-CoA decarbonylase/synthase complex subunit gamma